MLLRLVGIGIGKIQWALLEFQTLLLQNDAFSGLQFQFLSSFVCFMAPFKGSNAFQVLVVMSLKRVCQHLVDYWLYLLLCDAHTQDTGIYGNLLIGKNYVRSNLGDTLL